MMNASVLLSVTTVGLETILVSFWVLSALRMTLKSDALKTAVVSRLVPPVLVRSISVLAAVLAADCPLFVRRLCVCPNVLLEFGPTVDVPDVVGPVVEVDVDVDDVPALGPLVELEVELLVCVLPVVEVVDDEAAVELVEELLVEPLELLLFWLWLEALPVAPLLNV